MQVPKIIKGGCFSDERGRLTFNNDFNALEIKRFYSIENRNAEFIRGWQGHKIEQRWFSAILGSFKISLIKIDDWNNPNKSSDLLEFELYHTNLDVLHVPNGYISAIQSLEENSKLLVFSDYSLGETKDEFRFPLDYFENFKCKKE